MTDVYACGTLNIEPFYEERRKSWPLAMSGVILTTPINMVRAAVTLQFGMTAIQTTFMMVISTIHMRTISTNMLLQSIPQIQCTARLKYAARTRMALPADMRRYPMATISITS